MATTTKSDAECEDAIKNFVEITCTDEASAHSILQDVDYDLDEALARHFSAQASGPVPEEILREVEQDGLAPNTPRPVTTTRTRRNVEVPSATRNTPVNSVRPQDTPASNQDSEEEEHEDAPTVTANSQEGLNGNASLLETPGENIKQESAENGQEVLNGNASLLESSVENVNHESIERGQESPLDTKPLAVNLHSTPLNSNRFSPKRPHTTIEFEGEPPSKQSRIRDFFFDSDSTADEQQPGPSASSSRESEIDTNARFPPDVTILSYNIDGLDEEALGIRFTGVLTIVAKVNPDIIFFQEFVKELEPKLRSMLAKQYEIFTGECGVPYYTVTCVAKCIRVSKNEILKFYCGTQMGRNLLCVEGKWGELNVRLINSHLESCWDQAEIRKLQFSQAMEKMKEYSSQPDTLSIFGGDLNLRDPEVSNVPAGVQDVWIATGSNPALKYTWDTKLNTNKETKRAVRNRFDRFYAKSPYQQMEFRLEGRQKIKNCGRFPSDHFAIVTKFSAPELD